MSDIHETIRDALVEGKDFLTIMKDNNLSFDDYMKAFNHIAKQSQRKYKKQTLDALPFRLDTFIERMARYRKICDNAIEKAQFLEKDPPVEFVKMGSDLELAMFRVENEVLQGMIMSQMTRDQIKGLKKDGKSEPISKKEQGHVF